MNGKNGGDGIKKIILACSGGSNVGQISNSIMVEMDKRGAGDAYCLAGVGAQLPKFIENSKASKVIAIDGCPVACAKRILETSGIEPEKHFVVTELGIEKRHAFDKLQEETALALGRVLSS